VRRDPHRLEKLFEAVGDREPLLRIVFFRQSDVYVHEALIPDKRYFLTHKFGRQAIYDQATKSFSVQPYFAVFCYRPEK
jgi:hypothetical protein